MSKIKAKLGPSVISRQNKPSETLDIEILKVGRTLTAITLHKCGFPDPLHACAEQLRNPGRPQAIDIIKCWGSKVGRTLGERAEGYTMNILPIIITETVGWGIGRTDGLPTIQ